MHFIPKFCKILKDKLEMVRLYACSSSNWKAAFLTWLDALEFFDIVPYTLKTASSARLPPSLEYLTSKSDNRPLFLLNVYNPLDSFRSYYRFRTRQDCRSLSILVFNFFIRVGSPSRISLIRLPPQPSNRTIRIIFKFRPLKHPTNMNFPDGRKSK